MRKVAVVVLAMAMLMMFAAVAPALAAKPAVTRTYTILAYADPANPGTRFTTADKIMHGHKTGDIGYIYGLPWGTGTASSVGNWELDLTDLTGGGTSHITDSFSAGTIEGVVTMKFVGGGPYVYHGPTFTFEGVPVTDGMTFGGLLFEGESLKYGASGALDGLKIHGSWTGVEVFAGPPQLMDTIIMVETATFTG